MINSVRNSLDTILAGFTVLNNAAGAGRIFELYIMTGIAREMQNRGFEVWLQRSDGTRINPGDANRTFVQRGGAPSDVPSASDGPNNASVIGMQVRHHLCRDPHGATVVDPLLGVQHGHDQQRNRRAQAVLEVRVSHARIQKHLSPFFDPRAVIEIAWIELLEQELVPGILALVQRVRRYNLALRPGLRLSLPVRHGLGLRPLLRCHGNETHQPSQCEDDHCKRSLLLHIDFPCSRRTTLFVASLYRHFSPNCYICRNHCATARGSKRTAVPTRKLGSLWAFASL